MSLHPNRFLANEDVSGDKILEGAFFSLDCTNPGHRRSHFELARYRGVAFQALLARENRAHQCINRAQDGGRAAPATHSLWAVNAYQSGHHFRWHVISPDRHQGLNAGQVQGTQA